MWIFSLVYMSASGSYIDPMASTAISHLHAAVDGPQNMSPTHTFSSVPTPMNGVDILAFLPEDGSAEDESSLMTSPADLFTSPEAPQNNGPDQASATTISKRGSLRRTTVKQTGSFNLRGE